MSYSSESQAPFAMSVSAQASSANGSYATPPSGLTVPSSDLTMPASASLFTGGSSYYQTNLTSNLGYMAFCYNCGEDGHLSRYCKAPKKCFKCGGPGHVIKYCKDRLAMAPERGSRVGRDGAQSRKLGQQKEIKVKSIFDRDYGDTVAAMNETKTCEAEAEAGEKVYAVDTPDLIDLSSEPSESSSDDYDPAKYNAGVAPLHMSRQLYSKVTEGYSVKPQYDPVVELAEPSLLDQFDKEQVKRENAEGRVEVTLCRKRKGRKGRSTTYDLTPFLSY